MSSHAFRGDESLAFMDSVCGKTKAESLGADVENLTDGVCLGSGCHSDTGGAKDAKVEGNGGGAAGWNHGWSISARIFRDSCTSGVGAGDLVRNSFDDPEVVEGGGLDNGAIDWGAPIFSPERSS